MKPHAQVPHHRSIGRQQTLFKHPCSVEDDLQRGIELLKSSQWGEALACFEMVIDAKPSHTLAHYLAGLANYQLARPLEAMNCLHSHLELVPQDSNAWQVLGSICFDQAQFLAAKQAYGQALVYKNHDPELLGHLGLTLQKLGDWSGAMEVYNTLLRLNPESVLAHHQLALVHQALAQIEEALLHFQLAIALDDQSVVLHFDLGLLWSTQAYYQLAYLQFKRCLMLDPKHHPSHFNCGLIKHKERSWAEAIEHFDHALSLHDPYPVCWIAKGQTLMEQKRWGLAQALFEQVLELHIDHVDAWLNLGLVFKAQKQFELAQQCFVQILNQDPDHIVALNNLGLLCQSMGHHALATDCFLQCQNLDPSYLAACVNLSATHEKMGHYAIAMDGLQAGLERICIEYPVAVETLTRLLMRGDGLPAQLLRGLPIEWAIGQRNLGLMLLRSGDFERGWPLYDYRFLGGEVSSKYTQTQRPWFNGLAELGGRGERLQRLRPVNHRVKKLLIWAEQGVGDEIMFGSLLSEAMLLAQELVVQVDARLLGLFKRSYPELTFMERTLELDDAQFDAHLPMGSLPRILRPDLASFEAQPRAYLKADPERTLQVKAQLSASHPRPGSHPMTPLRCIGISWRSHNDTFGSQRSLALVRLVKQLQSLHPTGMRLINLQYGDVQADIDECFEQTGVRVEQMPTVDNFRDLEGLACLIQSCDEVVSVDNSTVHLAGALGQTVTALLPLSADWRWLEETHENVWYPSVRLIRQTALGDWESCWSTQLT